MALPMSGQTKIKLTRDFVRAKLKYDLSTGSFLWKSSGKGHKANLVAGWNNDRYWKIRVGGHDMYAHRLAFLYVLGWMPKQVDHINHDPTDNRWINLRAASYEINGKNRIMNSTNISGVNGVSFNKDRNRWCARIGANNKQYFLGRFADKEDAIAARRVADAKYGFHENHGKEVAK